jgi:hypothetical protein
MIDLVWFPTDLASECRKTEEFLYLCSMLIVKFFSRATALICLTTLCTFMACEDLDTVSLDITESATFTINDQSANTNGKDYSLTTPIDISLNPDLADYLDRIEKVEVNHIEYSISNSGPQDISLTNATIKTSSNLDIIDLQSISFSNGSSGELTPNPPGINDLVSRLKGSGSDQVKLSGYITRTPVNCIATVTFHFTVKVRAL